MSNESAVLALAFAVVSLLCLCFFALAVDLASG